MNIKDELSELLNIIDPECKPLAESIINELSFIVTTLENLRNTVETEGAIEVYKNGKQETTRQSPAFKGYYTLIPKYNALIKELIDLMPKSIQETGVSDLQRFLNEYE